MVATSEPVTEKMQSLKEEVLSHVFLTLLLTMCFQFAACSHRESKITKEEAHQICGDQLSALGVNLKEHALYMNPEHPITSDSIKDGKVRTAWYEDYPKWLERTHRRLEGKIFWKCECGPTKEATDGIYEIYIDSKSGKVLHVDGMSSDVDKWAPIDRKSNNLDVRRFFRLLLSSSDESYCCDVSFRSDLLQE